MNWEAAGAIGEVIGAVGVIASHFYLGRQKERLVAEEFVR